MGAALLSVTSGAATVFCIPPQMETRPSSEYSWSEQAPDLFDMGVQWLVSQHTQLHGGWPCLFVTQRRSRLKNATAEEQ